MSGKKKPIVAMNAMENICQYGHELRYHAKLEDGGAYQDIAGHCTKDKGKDVYDICQCERFKKHEGNKA